MHTLHYTVSFIVFLNWLQINESIKLTLQILSILQHLKASLYIKLYDYSIVYEKYTVLKSETTIL